MNNPEWSADEFRDNFPDVPAPVRTHLRRICNAALRNGMTREEVSGVFAGLSQEHPDELSATAIIDALQARIIEIGGEDAELR